MNRFLILAATVAASGLLSSGCKTTAPVTEVVRYDTVYVEVESAPAAEGAGELAAGPELDISHVKAGRFDFGKMWTFDNPPLDYFREEYDFAPDEDWFRRARLGALRITGCSASFVSPSGLVMTNHHCAREAVTDVAQPDEDLVEKGFYAASLSEERPIEGGYAEQLISITDVTATIRAAEGTGQTAAERAYARTTAIDSIEARMAADAGGEEAGFLAEVIRLYNGGQYSAYVFRRFDDVRLVMAPEVSVAYFGGDPDNFTYPRYNLDMSFYRVYVDDQPFHPEVYFNWSIDGTKEGDAVFVVGNPGTTNRLQTVAELEFRRDYEDKILLHILESRAEAMKAFLEEDPETAKEIDLQNTIFGIENSVKARAGILDGLNDPVLMARKRDAERQLRDAIDADSTLSTKYSGLFEETADLQDELADIAPSFGAFVLNPESPYYSTLVTRAALGVLYSAQVLGGVPEADMSDFKAQILEAPAYPPAMEKRLVKARLDDLVMYFGANDPRVTSILMGRTTEQAASDLVEQTIILNTETFESLLSSLVATDDPTVELGRVMAYGIVTLQQASIPVNQRLDEISGEIARARFEIYGTTFPPDATFSPRIADGVVRSYEYNGTTAPAYTTFYGMYDRYYSFGGEADWTLPERWVNPPAGFDLSIPLNLVTTNDIVGGNSGSPLLNKNLQIVGLVFDSNIDGLPGEFIYTDEAARAVAVDSRGIIEALDKVFDTDRIVGELLDGTLYETEEAADRGR